MNDCCCCRLTDLVEVSEQQGALFPDALDLGEVVILQTAGAVRGPDDQRLDQRDGNI